MEQRFPFLHALQDFSLEKGKSRSFLIFLALSFIFWLITKFSNQYTEVLPLEVSFIKHSVGVVPTSDTTSEIQLTLTASGFQLFFYKLLGTELILDSKKGVFNESTDHFIPLFGLKPSLGPIAEWGLEIEKNAIKVDTTDYTTNIPGIYAIGDVNTYTNKLKLILCGFHEGTLAVQSAFARIHPEKKNILKYTTVNGVQGF